MAVLREKSLLCLRYISLCAREQEGRVKPETALCTPMCPMITMESTIGTGGAARLLGITVKTLQRSEREGRLVPAARTASNRRRYT